MAVSGVDDLVGRLRGRLDERERQLAEDERVAQRAHPELGEILSWPEITSPELDADEAHVVRWNPARVLAEVERERRDIAFKRQLVEDYENRLTDHQDFPDEGEYELRFLELERHVLALAQQFEGEPGWREEWQLDADGV